MRDLAEVGGRGVLGCGQGSLRPPSPSTLVAGAEPLGAWSHQEPRGTHLTVTWELDCSLGLCLLS